MKVIKKLKCPAKITKYVPPKKIAMTTSQIQILKKLNIPIEVYAKKYMEQFKYKYRYC